MKIFKLKTINIFVMAAMAIIVFAMPVSASTTDGTIDSTDKYAWSENVGWINFGTTEGNVHITDSSLTGYAWSPKAGWISLNCSNDSSCAAVDYKVANDGTGNLSGYAWGENAGWINFNPTGGGVSIDSGGEFSGYAFGPKIGWIVFNCATTSSCATVDYKVKTDWRPQTARPQCNNSLDDDGDGSTDYPNDSGCSSLTDDDETNYGGGLPPGASNPPALPAPTSENPEGSFSVIINNGDKYTNNEIVTLKLNAGTDAARMAISNTKDFINASQIPYQEEMEWKLSSCHSEKAVADEESRDYASETVIQNNTKLNSGSFTTVQDDSVCAVYVKFYTQYGVSSETVSDSIIYTNEPNTDIPDGSLVKVENDYKVYILKNSSTNQGQSYLRHIPNPTIFSFYTHFKWDNIKTITSQQFDNYQVSTLVRELNDTKVYQIDDNNLTKHHLNITAQQFENSGRFWEMIYIINKQERDLYEMGEDVEE